MKLNFGFEDYPYVSRYDASSPLTKTVKSRRAKVLTRSQETYGQGKTTFEVAQELESKYHIVETFVGMEEDYISGLIEDVYSEKFEELLKYNKGGITGKETEKIEAKFRRALSGRKFDGAIPGVPTVAAQRGVSHLRQRPYAKRPPRPSFVDTGMYQRSFRVWAEDE